MLRILLADDHDIVRRGLKDLLEQRAGWTVLNLAAIPLMATVVIATIWLARHLRKAEATAPKPAE